MRISKNLKRKWIVEGFMRAQRRFGNRSSGIYEVIDAIRPGMNKAFDGLEGDDKAIAKQAVCWLAKKLRLFGFSFDNMDGTVINMLCSVVSEKLAELRGRDFYDYFNVVGDAIAEYDEKSGLSPNRTSGGSFGRGTLYNLWKNRDKY